MHQILLVAIGAAVVLLSVALHKVGLVATAASTKKLPFFFAIAVAMFGIFGLPMLSRLGYI